MRPHLSLRGLKTDRKRFNEDGLARESDSSEGVSDVIDSVNEDWSDSPETREAGEDFDLDAFYFFKKVKTFKFDSPEFLLTNIPYPVNIFSKYPVSRKPK